MRLIATCVSIVFILIFHGTLQSQAWYPKPLHPDLPFTSVVVDSSTPQWAVMLYSENPNIKEIRTLFEEWRKANLNVKNGHTRNYKHYLAFLVSNDAIDEDGYVDIPQDIEGKRKKWQSKRAALQKLEYSRSNNIWTSIGPTYVPETQGRVNAQANVYAIDQSKSHPDVLYCGTETDYVFKSIDRGESWTSVSENNFFGGYMEIEIHPTDPDIVYLGTSHEILKTTDGGLTWQSMRYNHNQRMSSIIIHPTNPDIVIAGGIEGMYKSTDGGVTWTTVTSTTVYDLRFKSDDPSVIFSLWNNEATSVTDFYRSTDTGSTWTKISAGWEEPDPSSSNKGGRMTTSDIYSDIIYTFTGASYTTLAVPKNGIKVRKSSDGGLTWQLLVDSDKVFQRYLGSGTSTINNGQGYYDWDIEMMDADTNTVLLGTQGKWLTKNGFSNDTLENWGAEVGGHSDLQEVLFNGGDLWVATDGGIVKCHESLNGYDIKMDGINCAEFWSFDQGWNRDAQVGTLYHNGTIGSTDTYDEGIFRFFGGAEPSFSALKHPFPDKIISKGYGSVNGRSMPNEFTDPETSFSYNLTPNSNYAIWATNEESEIEVSPYNYNIHWAGEDNKLMKSANFGVSWSTIFTGRVGGKITKIEIPKANADIVYVGEFHSSGYAIYKSTNGGDTFIALSNLPGIAGSSDDGVFISCDHADENVLYLAFRESDNDNDKVWKTEDGGLTWENINTGSDILDGESITDILAIAGTNGDLYLTTNHGVFHKSNTSQWMSCVAGLPINLRIRHIKPFYKEGQIRIATMNRGVYSLDMVNQPTEIVVQPTVSVTDGLCAKDTFYFEDFSTLNHDNASWSWTFDPTPIYIDDANKRNPKVLFSGNGTYQATLTITKDGIAYSDTLDKPIIIDSQCEPDDFPGRSYRMENYGDHAEADDLGLQLPAWTVSFWMKPSEVQQATATIFDALDDEDSRSFCANYYGSTPNLTMHYKGAGSSAWDVDPGMAVVANEWNHVAYTSSVETGDVAIYVNGESFVYPNVTPVAVEFEKLVIGWQDRWWGGRYYHGEIDELAIYNRALDQDEVRLRMHITKDLTNDLGLVHYYQWNEVPSGTTYDKVNIRHMNLPASKVISTGPFAGGSSSKLVVNSGGSKSFPNEGVEMVFPATGSHPNGEVVVTRLDAKPDFAPSPDKGSQKYWIVHNFGSNQTFAELESITFEGFGTLSNTEANNPSEFELYRRDFGQFGDTWGDRLSVANAVAANPINTIAYDPTGLSTFGQFYITKGRCQSDLEVVSIADAGQKTLRQAVYDACPNDTIYFSSTLDMNSILLTSSTIDITKSIYLKGNGKSNTIIDGSGQRRLFNVLDLQTNFGMENLALKNAYELTQGGAVLNYGNLSLKELLFEANYQGLDPKAISNYGNVVVKTGVTEVRE